ncbi:MAG: hypothetical protein QOG20_375 [Pseudonocardiales bacterium]|nr:hypothetical protein [Pseudonocardiales bacterium]
MITVRSERGEGAARRTGLPGGGLPAGRRWRGEHGVDAQPHPSVVEIVVEIVAQQRVGRVEERRAHPSRRLPSSS